MLYVYIISFKMFSVLPTKKSHGCTFCCGNELSRGIKQEKLIQIHVFISRPVRSFYCIVDKDNIDDVKILLLSFTAYQPL